MDTKIWLIRHGETDWNSQGKIQGHVDIPLNHTGLKQAKQVAQRMQNETIAACFSSDLQRARVTAEQIAMYHGLEVKIDPLLRERSFGKLEGMTKDEIDRVYPDYQVSNHANLGQETLENLRKRAMLALTRIADQHSGQSVAVVSHGAWINSFLYVISNGRVGTGITQLKNTSISTVIRAGQHWKIDQIGDAGHLLAEFAVEP